MSPGPPVAHPILTLRRREPRSPMSGAPGRAGALRTPRSTVLKLLPGVASAWMRGKAACHLLPLRARAEQDELGPRFLCPSGRLLEACAVSLLSEVSQVIAQGLTSHQPWVAWT